MKSADYFCSNPAHRMTDKQTNKQYPSHNPRLGAGNKSVADKNYEILRSPFRLRNPKLYFVHEFYTTG